MKFFLLFIYCSCCFFIKAQGFIQNAGQLCNQLNEVSENVCFTRQISAQAQLQLRRTGYSYELFTELNPGGKKEQDKNQLFKSEKKNFQVDRADFDFLNVDKACRIIPNYPLSQINFHINYENKSTVEYGQVVYTNLYPGIDLQFLIPKEKNTFFKYNIIVHPGADASRIKFKMNGAKAGLLNNELKINVGQQVISETIPLSFYRENHQPANLFFNLSGDTVSFKGVYDKTKTLIIDPVSNLVWSTYHGGSGVDVSMDLGIDGQNNLYTTGYTASTSNIATTGAFQSTVAGSLDVFLTKSSAGGQKIWSTYFGGAGVDIAYAIHVKDNGTSYIAGATSSTAGVTSSAAHQTVYGGGINDILVAAFSPGGQLLWSSYYGGADHDIAEAITCDLSGNILFSGHTESTANIATQGAYQTSYNFNYDVCLVKFTPAGQRIWGSYYGDSGIDETYAICTDSQRKIYITGGTTSISDMTTVGSHQQFPGGANDVFLARFDSTGSGLDWSTYLGGAGNDAGTGIDIANGIIYLGGNTSSSTNIASPGAQQSAPLSFDESFLAAFTTGGQRLWSTYFGGEDTDYIFDLRVDPLSQILICGASNSTMNISTPGAWQASLTTSGIYDAFFARYSSAGSLQFSSYFGGEGNDQARGIAIDKAGKIYLAGETTSTVGIASGNAVQVNNNGSGDAFLAKFCVPFKAPIYPARSATFCPGSITFSSAPGYSNYLWSNGLKINPMTVNIFAPGKYKFWLSANDGPDCAGLSDTTSITVSACLSLDEQLSKSQLLVSPSPADNSLLVATADNFPVNACYQISNLSGSVILAGRFFKMPSEIDITGLPGGLYLLQVSTPAGNYVKKFVKQ